MGYLPECVEFEANSCFGVGCCEQAVIPLHAKAFLLSIHFKN